MELTDTTLKIGLVVLLFGTITWAFGRTDEISYYVSWIFGMVGVIYVFG